MKNKLFTLLSTLFIGISCFASPQNNNDIQASINERDQKIYEIIKRDLASFLEIIPESLEKEHGFNSRSEFAKASAGPIYTIVGVDVNGKVFNTNMFNIPVIVDGDYRAMITVLFTDGKYEMETIGAAMLADELQIIEKEQGTSSMQEKLMLNIYSKTSGFVAYKDLNTKLEQADFIPLESAKTALSHSDRSLKATYKLDEAIKALEIK